jgi:hypothetical protein
MRQTPGGRHKCQAIRLPNDGEIVLRTSEMSRRLMAISSVAFAAGVGHTDQATNGADGLGRGGPIGESLGGVWF